MIVRCRRELMRAKFNECDVDHNGLVSLAEAKGVLMKEPFNFPEEKVTVPVINLTAYIYI